MKLIGKIWWFPLIIYMIIMPAFMSEKMDSVPCKKVKISITDSLKYRFVNSGDLFGMVQNSSSKVLGIKSGQIEIKSIEELILKTRELEQVEVYNTIDGTLHIDANQRDPLVRIITQFGKSYYIDYHGVIVPHSIGFTPRLTVVSGYIDIPVENIARGNILSIDENSSLKKIVSLVKFINKDEFWSGQIEQIWVNQAQELEIVPRAGNHIVKFGPPDHFEEKFEYLEEFYVSALPDMGWNKYKEINLRYQGQIICKKR